jgi:thiamine kinase-like enzyme
MVAKQRGFALQRICDELKSPVVFSHNDLLSGNFMCDNETGQAGRFFFRICSTEGGRGILILCMRLAFLPSFW